MIGSIEKRLGYLIGLKRRERLLQGNNAYKQENFIKCDEQYPFEGCKPQTVVCSLATLSRLENGKHDNNHALLDFFLKKLDIQYKIRESVFEKEEQVLNRITSGFSSIPMDDLIVQLKELKQFFSKFKDDPLISLDDQADSFIRAVLTKQAVTRQDYQALIDCEGALHPMIKDWLFGCGQWLKLNHPDFWDLKTDLGSFGFAEVIKNVRILRNIGDLDNEPFLASLVNRFHPQSIAMHKLEKMMDRVHDRLTPSENELMEEYDLCLMMIRNNKVVQEGHSELYRVLYRYVSITEPRARLDCLSDEVFPLLSHEPSPKLISIALSKAMLKLCQQSKSYKPLTVLVTLLSENYSHG